MLVRARFLVTAVALALAPLAVATPAAAHTGGPGGTFVDDNGSPHEGYVEAVFARQITGGCTAGWRTYCPGSAVVRGQMASFLARALSLPAASRDHFPDDAGNPHEDNINRVAEAQITSGDGAGLYRPELPVSRAQMASFLVRGFALEPSEQDRFTDDTGSPHEANINAVAQAGITTGCGGTSYCPNQSVTRGQMATFLGRALGLQPVDVPPVRTFGPGQYRVGPDIAAGTYRSQDTDYCYWERQSGFSGGFEDIIANDLTRGPTLVTIDPSDAGFDSNDCGTWTNDLFPITASPTAAIDEGTYQVGPEVASGTWRSAGPSGDGGCYWERLSGFGGEFEQLIDNDYVDAGQAVVTIESSDVGFKTVGCLPFEKIG